MNEQYTASTVSMAVTPERILHDVIMRSELRSTIKNIHVIFLVHIYNRRSA